MDSAYTIAIITILGSGVSAGVVTFWMNFWKAHLDFRKAKIEELYAAVHQSTMAMQIIGARKRGVILNVPNPSTMLATNSDRINLLIDLYFPRLLPASYDFTLAIQDFIVKEAAASAGFQEDAWRIVELGNELKAEIVKLSRQWSLRAWIEAVQEYDQQHS